MMGYSEQSDWKSKLTIKKVELKYVHNSTGA